MSNGITAQEAVDKIGNRFELVLIASVRARELKRGYKPLVDKPTGVVVTALREVAAGHIGCDYLLKVARNQSPLSR